MVRDGSESEGSFMGAVAARPPAEPLFVLKFGSPVSRSTAALSRIAGGIYRQRRRGLAVVRLYNAGGVFEADPERDAFGADRHCARGDEAIHLRGLGARPDWIAASLRSSQ